MVCCCFYRYGKIVSTKAILDKNTNQCKGEWEPMNFIQCCLLPPKVTVYLTTQILIWDFDCQASFESCKTNWCIMLTGFVLFFPHRQLINTRRFFQQTFFSRQSVWRQNMTNNFNLCKPGSGHVFASCVFLCVSSGLHCLQHNSNDCRNELVITRVPLFWFASLWRWFQNCTVIILGVKLILKARWLHCCHWPNQTREHYTIRTMCFRYSLCWTRLIHVSFDESLLDCWSGLDKAIINMIAVVCCWRGTQEHVFSMIAAHLPRMCSKGALTRFRTTTQMPCNQRISVNSMSEGKANLIESSSRDVNVSLSAVNI